ncbi:MAG: putative CRISPR-associated protein, partial [Chloroflexota bacterium]
PEGRWCAQVLSASFAGSVNTTHVETVSGLTYHHGSVVERGLRHLLQLVFDAIQEAGGPEHAVLCATGGFKIETAYVSLIGLLRRIPVYYVHERYEDLLSLPAFPIQWDLQWVRKREDFFRWIEAEPRPTAEVASRLKADQELRPLVQDDEDGNSYLNAAGWLLFRAFRDEVAAGPRAVWPPASTRTPEQKNQVSKEGHHRPPGWEQWVRRLTEIDCVESVSYEQAGHGRGGVRPQVYDEDPAKGELGILFGRNGQDLPLRVRTTARGGAQLALVRRHIESAMGRW